MDDADRVEQLQTLALSSALSHVRRYEGESARECHECGDEIPEDRREAVPGVTHCVECVAAAESRRRRGLV